MYAEGRCHVGGSELVLCTAGGQRYGAALPYGTKFRVKWAVEVLCSQQYGVHNRTNRTEALHGWKRNGEMKQKKLLIKTD